MHRTFILCLLLHFGVAFKCEEDDATCTFSETDDVSMLQSKVSVAKTGNHQSNADDVKSQKTLSDRKGNQKEVRVAKTGNHQRNADDVKSQNTLSDRKGSQKHETKCTIENNIKLTVTLISGAGLGYSSFFDSVDPYCIMQLVPTTGNKKNTYTVTDTIWDSPNPTWNLVFETFDYSCDDWINFACFDNDAGFTADDPIGGVNVTLTRGVDSAQSYSVVNGVGSLLISVAWTECSGDCQSLEATMGELANNVYWFAKQAGNYHLIPDSSFESGFVAANVMSHVSAGHVDNVGLYKHYDSSDCALVFSGSNDAVDWTENIQFVNTDMCGFEVHKGFAEEVQGYFASPDMVSISNVIASQCGGSAYFVGHSLGGAVADVAAACANSQAGVISIPGVAAGMQVFTAKALYTTGAPATSYPAFTSYIDGGCFAGLRSFNLDSRTYDIVPEAASYVGYLHPHVKAVDLHSNDDEELSKQEFPCGSTGAELYPFKMNADNKHMATVTDHGSARYWNRLQSLYPAGNRLQQALSR